MFLIFVDKQMFLMYIYLYTEYLFGMYVRFQHFVYYKGVLLDIYSDTLDYMKRRLHRIQKAGIK